MTTEQFVEEWNEGTDSFASDPPNAVLSFVEPGADTPSDVVVVLRDPAIGDDSITYAVEVLDGECRPPPAPAPCSSTPRPPAIARLGRRHAPARPAQDAPPHLSRTYVGRGGFEPPYATVGRASRAPGGRRSTATC